MKHTEERTRRPKLKRETSRELLKVSDKWHATYEELRKIEKNYKEYKNNPASKNYRDALHALTTKKPALEKELQSLGISLNKERFKAATGEDLASVENKAKISGDLNSWLLLLKWNMQYLEDNQLRALIYAAHKRRDASDVRFLEEIAHIITTPRESNGKGDKDKFVRLLENYDAEKSRKQIITAMIKSPSDIVSDEYLRRKGLFFRKKKKIIP